MSEAAAPSSELIATPIPESAKAVIDKSGLTTEGMRSLSDAFAPSFQEFQRVKLSASGVKIGEPKKAREIRLQLKAIRVGAKKVHGELKEDVLRRGRAVDGVKNILEYELVPIEKALEDIEKAEEIAEAKRKADLLTARSEELKPFADPSFYALGDMPDDQWKQLLESSKLAHAARLKAAEEEIAAKAKRDAEEAAERERIKEGHARALKVAEEERAAREELERKQAEENKRLAAERNAQEAAAAKERAETERKVAAERKAREEAEAKLEAQRKAEAERIAAEQEAAKKAAAAPDKEKVTALAKQVRALATPALATDNGKALSVEIKEQVEKFAKWLDAKAGAL